KLSLAAWLGILAIWTLALLTPQPVELADSRNPIPRPAKTVHAGERNSGNTQSPGHARGERPTGGSARPLAGRASDSRTPARHRPQRAGSYCLVLPSLHPGILLGLLLTLPRRRTRQDNLRSSGPKVLDR